MATLKITKTNLIDGCVYDTFNCSERVMRCAWKVE